LAGLFGDQLEIAPGWRITSEVEEKALTLEAIARLLEVAEDDEQLELLRGIARGGAERGAAASMASVVEDADELARQAVDGAWGRIAPLERPADVALSEAIRTVQDFQVPTTTKGKPDSRWAKVHQTLKDILEDFDLDLDRAALEEAMGKGFAVKALDPVPEYYKAPLPDDLVDALLVLHQLLASVRVEDLRERNAATGRLLTGYHSAERALRTELSAWRFSDFQGALLDGPARGERATWLRDVTFRLDGRIDHLLLDEFQDTSLFQWRALRPLAEEIVSDGTGERSFFAVGDVKQSIYSWRGGLPGILEHLPTMILPDGIPASLVDETLSLSWRTGPEILEVLNHLFSGLSGTSFPGLGEHFAMAASRFDRLWDPHRSAPSTTPGCFELIEAPEDPPSSNAAQRLEATTAATADLAEELHRRHPGLSIGILAPKNRIAADLVARLRRRGLDATGEGGGSFMDCGASIVFLDALRFAAHPGDSAAGFNLRHSPLGELLASDHPDSDQSGMARHLRLAFSNAGVSRTFESWCSRLGGILDRREIGRLERLVVETNRLEIGGLVDPLDLLQQLESLRLDEPGSDAIRVMTVHGSKGLAFDLVILTGLDGNLVRPAELVQERDPSTQELLRVARWVTKQLLPPEILPLQRS
ncbi:MAG: UvrD-helicase domain-containing protein, partial [Planctomycetota bacterium]|nr:UvrD-helicase domain-containing protein [Planctomycetota bacterium]